MKTRTQIERLAQPAKGMIVATPQQLLLLILEVLLDIREGIKRR